MGQLISLIIRLQQPFPDNKYLKDKGWLLEIERFEVYFPPNKDIFFFLSQLKITHFGVFNSYNWLLQPK